MKPLILILILLALFALPSCLASSQPTNDAPEQVDPDGGAAGGKPFIDPPTPDGKPAPTTSVKAPEPASAAVQTQ